MQETKYFKVVCKCGHVGRRNYVPIQFAVPAMNGREAAKKARDYKRVKRNHKDAILEVQEISLTEFQELLKVNENDPYLRCGSRHEQSLIDDLDERLVHDPHSDVLKLDRKARKSRVEHTLRRYKCLEDEARREIAA